MASPVTENLIAHQGYDQPRVRSEMPKSRRLFFPGRKDRRDDSKKSTKDKGKGRTSSLSHRKSSEKSPRKRPRNPSPSPRSSKRQPTSLYDIPREDVGDSPVVPAFTGTPKEEAAYKVSFVSVSVSAG